MATEATSRSQEVSQIGLWFGFSAAALCWMGLGIADVLITWRECLHHEQFGGASSHSGLLSLNIFIFFALLAIAIVAGIVSYRNWRRLSGEVKLCNAEATGSREYLALIGVFISVTLGIGMIWLGIPLLFLSLCVRIR
jgi:hypothetical protein